MALSIDEYVAEEIVIGSSISLKQMGLLGGYVKTEESISGRSYHQMAFILLEDIVDSWNILRAIHFDMDEQIVGIIIKVEPFLGSYP